MCCAADVLEGKGAVQVAITVSELLRFHNASIKSPTKNVTAKNSRGSSPAATAAATSST